MDIYLPNLRYLPYLALEFIFQVGGLFFWVPRTLVLLIPHIPICHSIVIAIATATAITIVAVNWRCVYLLTSVTSLDSRFIRLLEYGSRSHPHREYPPKACA